MKAHKTEHILVGDNGEFIDSAYDTRDVFYGYMHAPGIRIGVDRSNICIKSNILTHRDTDAYPDTILTIKEPNHEQ